MTQLKRQNNSKRTDGEMIGLTIPVGRFDAVLFDMDGVVTKTSIVHTKAWKQTFDAFLRTRAGRKLKPFSESDYLKYVDGKTREDGVISFLRSRRIKLPVGDSGDKPGYQSVYALGNLKNQNFLELLSTAGVESYETTVALIRTLKASGFKIGIVTASRNGAEILKACNLEHVFDVKVDGLDAAKLNLPGKPEPNTFLEAARRLGVSPGRSVVVEDASAGVEAGHRGRFGLVIGVARANNQKELKRHGADEVVSDLGEVMLSGDSPLSSPGTALFDLDIADDNWILTYNEFSPESEGQRESICALGNGYFGTRAAAPESRADDVHYPATYLAGGYNRLKLSIGGQQFEQEELVNMPNWLFVSIKPDGGQWLDLKKVKILEYTQQLDLKAGIVIRNVKFEDQRGRQTSLKEKWLVHMRQQHMAAIEACVTAENWSGNISFLSALDGRVVNNGTSTDTQINHKHLNPVGSDAKDGLLALKMITNQSELVVAQAARHFLSSAGKEPDSRIKNIVKPDYAAQEITTHINESQAISLRKLVSMFSSKDRGISEPMQAAREAVVNSVDFDTLVDQHREAWRTLWRHFDLFIETTEAHPKMIPSLLLHLNSFHALQAASPNTIDLDTGLPSRGWTGEGYEGHIFWDDLFVFPFINLRMPDISRAFLKYRFRRLDSARRIARSLGAKGARFPWQSGSDGREETPEQIWLSEQSRWLPDTSHLQIHVGAAIAYNIWQYFQVTSDLNFMRSSGAEMLLEIARFFASYSKYNKLRRRYEIHNVVGPDEFHSGYPGADAPGINNNAYTNIMAAWTLCRASELMKVIPVDHAHEICQRLGITSQEIELWDQISRKMYVPILPNGIISQFEGYHNLEEFPRDEDGALDMVRLSQILIEQDLAPNQYKVSKQADVLMLFYIFSADELRDLFHHLGYRFKRDTMLKNVCYYLPRTANLSTLSRVAHAWVLSKLDRPNAWKLVAKKDKAPDGTSLSRQAAEPSSWSTFLEALESDFTDVGHGSTGEGIHIGAMAGAIDIVQRCYTGIVTRGDVLWLNPQLPTALIRLSFSMHYRRQLLRLEITQTALKVTAQHSSASAINIGFNNKIYQLEAGANRIFDLTSACEAVSKRSLPKSASVPDISVKSYRHCAV